MWSLDPADFGIDKMNPDDIERDAYRYYRPTIPADRIRSRSGKRKRRKNSRQRSRSLGSYGTGRTDFIRVTTRPKLSAAALVQDGSFSQKAQQVYGDSLMTSNGDTVTVHISELQQFNLELMRAKLVAHTFNARFNSDGHDLDESSRDLQTYGKIETSPISLQTSHLLPIYHECSFLFMKHACIS